MSDTLQNQPTINQQNLDDLLKLIEQAGKPGYKTTEFYTTAFTTLTSLVTGLVGYLKMPPTTDLTGFVPLGIMLVIIFLATRQYVIARTEIKQSPLVTTALQASMAASANQQTG